MRFLKVFLSAVFLFAFFNAYAQPITGAFGLKLGEYVPDWPEGDVRKAEITDFKDDFFDSVRFYVLPHSKRIYRIQGIKIVKTLCGSEEERNALIDTLREKYGKYEKEVKEFEDFKFKAEYKDSAIYVFCGAEGHDFTLYVSYLDWSLVRLEDKERKMIEKEKIDSSKL